MLIVACRDSGTEPVSAGPVDASQSEVSVSAPIIASGDTAVLTLITRDAKGQPLARGGHTVVFERSGGISTGSIGPTTDRGNGSYVATFRGVVAGLATTIGASIDGEPVTRPLPTIRVRPGKFSPTLSILTVTPRTILAGGKATLELITRDAAGNFLETGGLQVSLTTAGGSGAGVVGPVTDHNNGRYSATFTATQTGSPIRITASADGAVLTTPAPTVTVARGLSVDLSVITLSSDSVSVNGSLVITFEARDSAGVARTSGGETLQFFVMSTAQTGDGTLDSVRDHDDGTYTATFTATRHGAPVTIGVSLNGRTKNTALPSVTVLAIPLTAQKSTVSVSADSVEAGESATFSLVLQDLNGAPVTSAAQSVRFTITNADGASFGTLGPTVEEPGGRYKATFSATRAGTPSTVGVTLNDSTRVQMLDSLGNSHLPTITVTPGPATPDSSLLFADPTTINIRDSATVRLLTRDAYGNVLKKGGRRVTFARSGGAGVSVGHIGPVTDREDGTYTAQYFADSAGGPDAISAVLDGVPITSAAPTITVGPECTAGPISFAVSDVTINDTTPAQRAVKTLTLPSGVTTTITVRVKDALGCSIKQPLNVVFGTSGGSSTGVFGPLVSLGDGRHTATFTGHTAGSATQIDVSVDGTAVTSKPVTISVVPGDISTRTSQITASQTTVAVGATLVLTLVSHDAAGNRVLVGGRAVTFIVAGNQTHGVTSATTDGRDGTYSATYISSSAGSDTVVVLIDGTRVAQSVVVTAQN